MDALGDTDGTTGSKGFPSTQVTQVDQQQKELLDDQLNKLQEAYTKKDYDGWLVLWPRFEKECKAFLETHGTTKLPDFHFGPLGDADDTEFDLPSEFNLGHLPLPTGDDWLKADVNPILDEFVGTTKLPDFDFGPLEDGDDTEFELPQPLADQALLPPPLADQALLPPPPANEQAVLPPPPPNKPASVPPLADQALLPPPPANEQALLPPPPANKPASPPPLADQALAKLIQADTHASEASILINEAAIDGSIELNEDSVDHIDSCHTQISSAKESVQAALFHLGQARLVNKGDSLSQLMMKYD